MDNYEREGSEQITTINGVRISLGHDKFCGRVPFHPTHANIELLNGAHVVSVIRVDPDAILTLNIPGGMSIQVSDRIS